MINNPFEPFNLTLVANTWTKAYDKQRLLNSLRIANTSDTDSIHYLFSDNPYALDFDGAATHVDISAITAVSNLLGYQTGSINVRFKPDAFPNPVNTIFGISIAANPNDFIQLSVNSSGELVAQCDIGGTTQWVILSGTTLVADNWYNVQLSHNRIKPSLTIDGVDVTNLSVINDTTHWFSSVSFDDARIGAITISAAQAQFFDGLIDFVRIYKGVEGKNPRKIPNATYNLDEGSGTVINDTSGNGYTGTASADIFASRSSGTFLGTEGVEIIIDETFLLERLWLISTGAPTVNIEAKKA